MRAPLFACCCLVLVPGFGISRGIFLGSLGYLPVFCPEGVY